MLCVVVLYYWKSTANMRGENDENGTFSLVGIISPQERDVKPIFTMEGEQLLLPSFSSPLVLGGREVPCVLSVCVCSGRILSFYGFFIQFITRSTYALAYLFRSRCLLGSQIRNCVTGDLSC